MSSSRSPPGPNKSEDTALTPAIVELLEHAATLAYSHARDASHPHLRRLRRLEAARIERVLVHARIARRSADDARHLTVERNAASPPAPA
jgi:hypothetical protein